MTVTLDFWSNRTTQMRWPIDLQSWRTMPTCDAIWAWPGAVNSSESIPFRSMRSSCDARCSQRQVSSRLKRQMLFLKVRRYRPLRDQISDCKWCLRGMKVSMNHQLEAELEPNTKWTDRGQRPQLRAYSGTAVENEAETADRLEVVRE